MRACGLALLLLLVGSEAFAFCIEPSPPSPPWGSVPSPPFCGTYGDLSNCSEWEIGNFRSEIEDYIEKMKNYADDASEFTGEAVDFTKCQIDQAVEEWNNFIGR